MTADPASGRLMDSSRSGWGRRADDVFFQDARQPGRGQNKSSSAGPGSEEQWHPRHRDGSAAGLEKRIEELEKELARERRQTATLLKAHQDKDNLIEKLKDEIDLLNRDLDDTEEEIEQLKQENKTLLKVVSQLTR